MKKSSAGMPNGEIAYPTYPSAVSTTLVTRSYDYQTTLSRNTVRANGLNVDVTPFFSAIAYVAESLNADNKHECTMFGGGIVIGMTQESSRDPVSRHGELVTSLTTTACLYSLVRLMRSCNVKMVTPSLQ
jgi:hypothetical protein